MNPAERARRRALCAGVILVLAVYGFAARSGPLEAMGSSAAESYYNLLVRGFQSGHLSLSREAPAALARLPDPYDPVANVRLREAAEPLHDLSYYRGKLYLYFGVTPALLLFWPYAALTGHYLLHRGAAAIFCAGAFLAAAVLLRSIQRRHFPEARAGVLAGCALALGLATGMPILLARADVYEVAIAGGAMGIFLSLAALWRALQQPGSAGSWLAAASTAYGVAVASRPSLLPGAAILLIPVFWGEGRRDRRWLRNLGCAAGPLILIGLGLLVYNDRRFGAPLEFGQRYQLAGSRQDAGHLYSPRFLWFNFRVYFLEPGRWTRSFPFVGGSSSPSLPAGHRPVEDPFGVLVDIPLAWLALAAPLAWRGRPPAERAVLRSFVIAIAWLCGSAVLVLGLLDGNCSRYEVDFLPELILLAVLGVLGLERTLAGRPTMRHILGGAGSLLLGLSVAFNLLAAIAHYARARSDFGGLLLDAGRPEAAIGVLEETLRWQPDLSAARVELGDAYVQQGRTTDALAQFAQVVRKDPDDFEARANLANVLMRTGRFEEGIEQFRGALRVHPGNAAMHGNLGLVLAKMGRMDEAAAEFREAVRLDPGLGAGQSGPHGRGDPGV